MQFTLCDRCGQPLSVGDFPFCPHGRASAAIETDEAWIGGRWIENLGHEPVLVTSRQHLQREMEARGLEQHIKYVPGDHHLTDWSKAIDPQTLANVRELLTRGDGRAK